jgi:hypothetical protein
LDLPQLLELAALAFRAVVGVLMIRVLKGIRVLSQGEVATAE